MLKLNEYFMIRKAAAYLGVTTNTLRAWEKSGILIPYVNPINKYWLYKPADLEAFLATIVKTRNVPSQTKNNDL